jgi:hypothetical protein
MTTKMYILTVTSNNGQIHVVSLFSTFEKLKEYELAISKFYNEEDYTMRWHTREVDCETINTGNDNHIKMLGDDEWCKQWNTQK